MKLSEAYRTRAIRFLELWDIDEWKLKVYGITYTDDPLAPSLVHAAREVASARIRENASQTHHYGVGFVGIHQGKTGNFVFVDWWADENELHHHVYVSPSAQPSELEYKTPSGLTACAWDLFLIGHERDAWVGHVLRQHESPDLEAYLGARLNGDV
ncbi:isochorismatase [Elongatibacter sediminis]|uniref:Isochorismatase n=1 Tax=Elongatibacter sediminis TaxID=3119006 RepID=A0AAW9RK85_9GAMM